MLLLIFNIICIYLIQLGPPHIYIFKGVKIPCKESSTSNIANHINHYSRIPFFGGGGGGCGWKSVNHFQVEGVKIS